MKGLREVVNKKKAKSLTVQKSRKLFCEINGRSHRSQLIYKRKKCLNQKPLRFLISEIELHCYENESKTVQKNVFLNSFLMSLKQTAIN